MAPKAVVWIFILVAGITVEGSSVPVLMWGNNGVVTRLSPPLAGHTIGLDILKQNYLDSLIPCKGCHGHNVIVFLQDQLKYEDLLQFGDVYSENGNGGVFRNIKSLMNSNDESVCLSSVEGFMTALDHLRDQFGSGHVHDIDSLESLRAVAFDKTSRLVIVHLADTHSTSEKREIRLAANDKLIGAVVAILKKNNVPYAAIFSAHDRAKKVVRESVNFLGRHLLEDPTVSPASSAGTAVNVTGCILFYYKQINISISAVNTTGSSVPIVNTLTGIPDTTGTTCANSSSLVMLNWTMSDQILTNVEMSINFTKNPQGEWWVESWYLSYDGSSPDDGDIYETDVKMSAPTLYGPPSFSYSCNNLVLKESLNTTSVRKTRLTLVRFQVQPFNLMTGKFGYANDCTPFFSIPILSGLIVSFVLLSILAFGLYMVASITTMDRFDDPKGKGLTVNLQDK